MGNDRTRWPAAARDDVMRLEKKQQVDSLPHPSPRLPFLAAVFQVFHLAVCVPAWLPAMASAFVAAPGCNKLLLRLLAMIVKLHRLSQSM